MNIRAVSKISILNDTLIKFFGLFIIALSKVQTVNFEKLAVAFENDAKTFSSLRRIQRFIADYILDTNIIARLIFALLPHQPPFRLALDRTNCKFGSKNINILVLSVVYQGVAFPALFSMMDKFGYSSIKERIDLMQRYIHLFGDKTIDCLLADREFIGDEWTGFLNDYHIRYYIRIRENFKVFIPRKNETIKTFWLFMALKIN